MSAPPPKRLSLTNDLVFKTLFCRQPHLLADLINAVRYHAPPITVERILNPHILPEDISGKGIVLDVLVQDTSGTRFNVEMQVRRYLHWPERIVFYTARSLAGQLSAGDDYQRLKPAIGIGLLSCDLFDDQPQQADWHFTLRDGRRTQVQLGQAMQVHIIELQKADRLHDLPAELSAWIRCLQHSLDDDIMSQISHPPAKEALQHLTDLCSDEELQIRAVRRAVAIADWQDSMDCAKQEGQAAILEHLLTHKFGALPAEIQARLARGSLDQLNTWALRCLDATTLNDVFADA